MVRKYRIIDDLINTMLFISKLATYIIDNSQQRITTTLIDVKSHVKKLYNEGVINNNDYDKLNKLLSKIENEKVKKEEKLNIVSQIHEILFNTLIKLIQ